jgi:hypothetical protein
MHGRNACYGVILFHSQVFPNSITASEYILFRCFSDFPSTSIFCSDDLGFVQVQCTYDVRIQDTFSPGTEDVCSNNQTTCADNTTGSSSSIVIVSLCSAGHFCYYWSISFIHKSKEKWIYFNSK